MYIHGHTCTEIHEHVCTCLYHVQTRIYCFAISCPGWQDSRCAVLMRHSLHVADSCYLPWNEAYRHSLSLSSLLLLMRCWEGMPNERHFFTKKNIKQGFCSKILCLLCFMLSTCRFQFMTAHLFSCHFDFHVLVDFGFNISFPHIFSVLHPNSIKTS